MYNGYYIDGVSKNLGKCDKTCATCWMDKIIPVLFFRANFK